jgi:hypothetical protein
MGRSGVSTEIVPGSSSERCGVLDEELGHGAVDRLASDRLNHHDVRHSESLGHLVIFDTEVA